MIYVKFGKFTMTHKDKHCMKTHSCNGNAFRACRPAQKTIKFTQNEKTKKVLFL